MNPLHAILVGCGSMANTWVKAALTAPDLELVGLIDVHRPAAEAMAQRHPLPAAKVYDTLTEAIDTTGAEIVFDVTVPDAHDAVTLEALGRGCHVLGEKPMSVSLPRAQRMVAAAEEAGRIYAVIQNRRYDPNIVAFAELVQGGQLGSIEELHSDFFLGPHFGGFRDQMDNPLLVDMAIHTFDAARYISAADPVAVYCHGFNPGRSWYRGHASAAAIFEMTGGLVFTYRGSWAAEGLKTSWNSHWRAIGAKGSATWNGEADIKAERVVGDSGWMRPVEEVPVSINPMQHTGHAGLIHEFVDCVRSGQRPQTHAADNIKSLAMVLAAVESAECSQRVTVRW